MKRKLIALGLTLALILVSVVSGTLAYLTDTDQAVNVFTVGNVDIKFDEKVGVYDDGDTSFANDLGKYFRDENGGCVYKGIVPTNVIKKDATVTNDGNAPAYVRVLVVMNNRTAIEKALTKATVAEVFMGWGATYADGYVVKAADGVELVTLTNSVTYTPGADETAWVYYLKLAPGAVAEVFDGLMSPTSFDNEENKMFDGLKIEIYADAIQVEGFADADEAFAALEAAHELDDVRTSAPSVKYEVSNVEDLKIALANGGNIALANSITIDEPLEVANGTVVNLDLGVYDISFVPTETVPTILNNGTLTISGSGIVSNSLSNPIMNTGTLTVNGGTYNGASYGINNNSGTVTVNSCDIVSGGGIYTWNGNVVINGGDFEATSTGRHTIYAGNSNVTINGGNISHSGTTSSILASGTSEINITGGTHTVADGYYLMDFNGTPTVNISGGDLTGMIRFIANGTTNISGGYIEFLTGTYASATHNMNITGGTFASEPNAEWIADGYNVVDNGDGTYTVARITVSDTVTAVDGNTPAQNGDLISDALNAASDDALVELNLSAGEYKMPSVSGSQEFVIKGTKDTVIDNTLGSYMDSATVSFEGVTIKGSTGYANGATGGDYAALYTPNVTYTNCTFVGPFKIGRDGAKFINCEFTNLGNDYVWTYGNDVTFENCVFDSEGKAILIYSDGGTEISKVTVKDCEFNATMGRTAYHIVNQNCAAIEIQNYGNGVDLTLSNNTVNDIGDNGFSGEWRIKNYVSTQPGITVNGVEYTSTALDGKLMTVDADRNASFN